MKWLKYFLITFFFFYIFSFTFTTSSDFTQDLGRHLKIGEIIVKTKSIPSNNLFSYTNPNHQFINHHWLSEVIFYLFSKTFGLNSLIILKVICILVSVGLVFKLSSNKFGIIPTVVAGLILSPLFLERNDIRPEIFGYLFFSFILYVLFSYPKKQKLIFCLPVVMLLWINMHITFIFGIFLILILITKIFLNREKNYSITNYSITFISLFVLLFNPHGLTGVFYPFNIFKDYGYTIVENQNLFYLSKMIFNPLIKYFFLISPIVILASIVLITVNQLTVIFILLTFFGATVFQLRHLPFFVLSAIPVFAMLFNRIGGLIAKKHFLSENLKLATSILLIFILCLGSIFFILNKYYLIFDQDKRFGLGFNGFNEQAIEFINKNNLENNIFNNFDIGGYFIFELYPKYKVFIDNRPEAYPADFIENVYKQLQIESVIQSKIFDKYKIKTIFFNHGDQTQWGEIFIRRIINDKDWSLVYLDPKIFIMTKKDGRFKDIRENKERLKELVLAEDNYLSLLRLSRFFSLINEIRLAELSFLKAGELNPTSCSIIKTQYSLYQNNPQFYFYKSQELKRRSWYCF